MLTFALCLSQAIQPFIKHTQVCFGSLYFPPCETNVSTDLLPGTTQGSVGLVPISYQHPHTPLRCEILGVFSRLLLLAGGVSARPDVRYLLVVSVWFDVLLSASAGSAWPRILRVLCPLRSVGPLCGAAGSRLAPVVALDLASRARSAPPCPRLARPFCPLLGTCSTWLRTHVSCRRFWMH